MSTRRNSTEKRPSHLPQFMQPHRVTDDDRTVHGVRAKELWAGHSGALKDMNMTVLASTGSNESSAADQAVAAALAQAWMNRLQTLSAVTTFFAGMDGSLLGFTAPLEGTDTPSQIVHAGLAGALVLHLAASIIAYVASFFLLKYELVDAAIPSPTPINAAATAGFQSQQAFAMPGSPSLIPRSPSGPVNLDQRTLPPSITLVRANPFSALFSLPANAEEKKKRDGVARATTAPPSPPLTMLTRSHTLCIWLTALGFVLALVGVEAYCWTSLAQGTSIFVSTCLGLCFVCGAIVLR